MSTHAKLRGKVVVITGASSGIGRATALALAREGARLAIAARNTERLNDVERELASAGCDVLVCRTDVTDPAQVHRLVRETVERFGVVDIVICSAGQYIRAPRGHLCVEDFERAMAVNFYGALYLLREVLPLMLARGAGHLVVVSSVDGKKGLPLDAPYVASKFALTGMMDVVRQDLRGSGVLASTILPGRVDTPMIAHLRVPGISRKTSAARVARAVIRALKRNRGEVIVPFLGPKLLLLANSISPRLGDMVVRLFHLEGREEPGEGIVHAINQGKMHERL